MNTLSDHITKTIMLLGKLKSHKISFLDAFIGMLPLNRWKFGLFIIRSAQSGAPIYFFIC